MANALGLFFCFWFLEFLFCFVLFSDFFLSEEKVKQKLPFCSIKISPKHQEHDYQCKQVLALDHAGNVDSNTKAHLFPKLACLLSSTVIYALQGGGVLNDAFQQIYIWGL